MKLQPAVRYFAVVVALCFLSSLSANAQPSERIPDPTLLKRLAEAVDGNRTGKPIYVVASYDLPNPVRGVFPGKPDAEALARRLGKSYAVFGPYSAPFDGGWLFLQCRHDRVTSSMMEHGLGARHAYEGNKVAIDTTGVTLLGPYCPPETLRLSDVEDFTLTVKMKNGTVRSVPISNQTDAVFLSLAAIDKFVIPYYSRVIGVEGAAAMRRDIVKRIPGR